MDNSTSGYYRRHSHMFSLEHSVYKMITELIVTHNTMFLRMLKQ